MLAQGLRSREHVKYLCLEYRTLLAIASVTMASSKPTDLMS